MKDNEVRNLCPTNGITGRDLVATVIRHGTDNREAQRLIQRALDRGYLEIGPSMKLYPGDRP